MKITVIGATGATGLQLVQQLLASGHSVTALVRTPEKLGELKDKVTIVQGDARDASALENAIADRDAVLSALGPRSLGKDNLQAVFATSLVAAMTSQNVSRFIALSALGAGDSAKLAPLPMKLIRATVLKHTFDDKDKGEAIIVASPLNYTLVRPGRLTNKPAKGNVTAQATAAGLSGQIARADVASFMISQLTDPTWERKTPIIGYKI